MERSNRKEREGKENREEKNQDPRKGKRVRNMYTIINIKSLKQKRPTIHSIVAIMNERFYDRIFFLQTK